MPMPANRPTNPCLRLFSYKLCSAIVGILHFILMVSVIIGTDDNKHRDTGSTTFVVIICLLTLVFCVLLLVGLCKNVKPFVTAYLVYFAAFILMLVIGLFYSLFSPSVALGVGGFFYALFGILVYVLFFAVVFIYYRSTYSGTR